jgi:hypothetical protein
MRYAIGEIVLVVIGILIAIQVNNWNQKQQNNQKEIEILLGVTEELKNLIERLEFWADFNKTGERLTSEILKFKQTNANKQTMDSLFTSLIYVNVFDKGGGFLETLVNDGKFELIKDDLIRKQLSRWPDRLEDIHTNDLSVRDFVWHEIIPFLAEYGIPEFSCDNNQIYCFQDKPISDTYLDLLENNQFKSLLRHRNTGFKAIANDHETKANVAKTTLKLIKVYLKNVE